MRYLILSFLALFIIACGTTKTNETKSMNEKKETVMMDEVAFDYPVTRKDGTVTDNYHGTIIPDPYRWLEDDHSEETMNWVQRQNAFTFEYLHRLPAREKFIERLTTLWDYEKFSTPFKEGNQYYYFKNDGLQNQPVLYSVEKLGGKERLVIDPNKFSEDGTTSLGGIHFDKDGNYMAYTISEGGSDWRTAYVMDLKTGKLLKDKIEWIKFSGLSWYKDGFFYSRYPSPKEGEALSGKNEFHKVYYHKLGTPQAKDKLILEDEANPQRNFYASTTEDERYLIISPVESTSGNALYVKDLVKDSEIVKLVDEFDSDYGVVNSDGNRLIVITNDGAPNQKLMAVDVSDLSNPKWETLIEESENSLSGASIVGNKIFANYLENASSKIKVHDMDGSYIQNLKLPAIGSTEGISGKKNDTQGFFSFTSFTFPTTIYRLDVETMKYEVFKKPEVDFDPADYVTEQKWYTSKDGTKVPMFITYKKGVKMNGDNPTLLYGYGGFNIPMTPGFNVTRIPLLENNGIYAVANIRGGGEFGKAWHKAGTKEQKQNVFDDFIAAAEYLIENDYTSSKKLAIEGGSNGGLLIGACMTQRPDLFQVAFPAVGVLDMLRYHLFTIGWAWANDYGRSDDQEAFKYLIKYSPLHNVKEIDYPATLVTTADHDDRVVPAHSFKFISELQDKHTGSDPVMIRIETSAGHGAGKPTSKRIEEAADKYAFMFYNMAQKVLY